MKLYQKLSHILIAMHNCEKSENDEWCQNHKYELNRLVLELPSGSGIDSGSKIDIDRCEGGKKLVLYCDYHHMDEYGSYCGWTNHEIIVKPSLAFDLEIRITGKDRNGIKEYLHQVYSDCLDRAV